MKPRRLLSVTEPVEALTAWYAACVSVMLAAAATAPGAQLKVPLVFSLSFTWLTWLAWEWGRHRFAYQLETAEEMLP